MLEATTLYTLLLPSLWVSLAVYASWYFTSAKRYAPMTSEEVRALWEIHKQKNLCRAKHWKKIVHKNKLVGFKCGCGYSKAQKRPII